MGASAWDEMTWRVRRLHALPPLAEVVLPRRRLLREALGEQIYWLVGPPKIGKTVIAHYAAYLTSLNRRDVAVRERIILHDGSTDCARGMELLLEGPTSPATAVILENPLAALTSGEDVTEFVDLLARVRDARTDLRIVLTSRPAPYIATRDQLDEHNLGHATDLTIGAWYDPETLLTFFGADVPDLTLDLATELGCPGLIVQLRDHALMPTQRTRDDARRKFGEVSEEITLDKVAALAASDELAILSMVLRLQEYAFSLPTVDEVALLLDRPLTDITHFGLVANTFEFDDQVRLRFEHATTRDAADLLLREETATNSQRLRSIIDRQVPTWPRRALELWKAEQSAIDGRWDEVAAVDRSIRREIAAQLVSHAAGAEAGVACVAGLDFDPWTAQDVGYALANGWHRDSGSTSYRRLAQRLARDRAARGGYALLEALLYVRSAQVADLWRQVDEAFDLAVDEGPPWTGEPLKELMLAIDAFAWRPPPPWKSSAGWIDRFLSALAPTDDAWALIRFLRGYHADGLDSYLLDVAPTLADALRRDESHQWTSGQSDLGLWLVQWHFVHQCRARAQFAHQPWVAREYLGRAFHEATVIPDRDRNVAELVRSVTAAREREAGWGFFLAENLRAIDPASCGPETLEASSSSLQAADPRDGGVLAAVLTYQPDPSLATLVHQHFRDDEAKDALFDALVRGLVVDGVRLAEPRFAHRRDLGSIYSSAGIEWAAIKAAIPAEDAFDPAGAFDADGFIRRFDEAAANAPLDADPLVASRFDDVLERLRAGDLRPIEQTMASVSRRSRSRRGLSRGRSNDDHDGDDDDDPYTSIVAAVVFELEFGATQ